MDEMNESGGPEEGGRDDGFDGAKKRLFLLALRRGETVSAACELVGISRTTAYNHRERDADFAHFWKLARSMATLPLELVAWERGVVGVEEPVYTYGKYTYSRVRRSDPILRKLLEAEDPDKYGRSVTKERLTRAEKTRIEREVQAEFSARTVASLDETCAALAKRLKEFPPSDPGLPPPGRDHET